MTKTLIASFTKKDFRIDTFRCGGPGGQNQNKVNSGVRITCIPLGLSSECREYRDQPKNKKECWRKLSQKIKQYYTELEKKDKVKSTEIIRTYHAVENRVKDHKSGFRQSYDEVMNDISQMINARFDSLIE